MFFLHKCGGLFFFLSAVFWKEEREKGYIWTFTYAFINATDTSLGKYQNSF